MEWLFRASDRDAATVFFWTNGFVGFDDLFTEKEAAQLREATALAHYSDTDLSITNDVIFSIPLFERVVKDERLWGTAAALIGRPIELYNSKLNAKPMISNTGGVVEWHQDFPFFPHSNFDCLCAVIHMDDESDDAGPLRVIPGSHKWGPLSHEHDGKFVGRCWPQHDPSDVVTLRCKPGTVIFHHCLMVHRSDAKTRAGYRRHLIFGLRPQGAVQLGGKVWKSTGVQLMPPEQTRC
jgi:phytanoyl-CoA hydroxylase